MTIPQFPRHLPSPDDQPITTLYVNHWTPPVSERRQEIDECLRRNLECPAIDRIVLLASSTPEHRRAVPASPKLVWVDLPVERARYSDLFAAINACTTTPWDLNIAANSDVFFDETLNVLKVHDLFGVCVALSRWEVHDGQDETLAGDNSQDAWIFQGPVRPCADPTDFPIGTYGCDWKIAWVLRHADYALINCPYDVRHHHLHQCPYRNNGSMTPGPYVSRIPYQRLAEAHVPRGRHSRGGILAFSLWGDDPRYTVGAVENAKLAKWIYPDWTVRVHTDGSVPEQTVADLRAAGAEIIPAPKWDQWLGGMFWRLQAIDDPGFVRWGIRDADSRLTYRERQAVDSWIDSGWPLHTIRDHPGHQQPVMLCGFDGQRAAIQDIGSHIAAWRVNHGDGYGSDEAMIRERLWPEIRAKTLVHSEFGNLHGHGGVIRPFPTKSPERFRFIGERIYEDNHPNGEDRDCYIPARWAVQTAQVSTSEAAIAVSPVESRPQNGIVVLSIGADRRQWLWNCLASIQRHAPDMPVHVISDVPVDGPFTWVSARTGHASRYYKTQIHHLSPFEGITLFLDDDTVLHRRLPPFEEILGDAALAMAVEPRGTISRACQSGNDGFSLDAERAITVRECGADTPYYNSGVIFWRKTPHTLEMFDCWHREWMRFQHVDQLALARALTRCNMHAKALEPSEYNCRTDWFDGTKSSPYIFHFSRKHHENWYHSTHALPAEPHAAYRAFSHAVDKGMCSRAQYSAIGKLVCRKRPCNMLVWGCGADSSLWRTLNVGGRTVFVEHDRQWAARAEASGCEIINVEYPTRKGVIGPELPSPVAHVLWDIVFIDAPPGLAHEAPGRELPIRWTGQLPNSPIIALHDYERPWERWCADKYLGRPSMVSALDGQGQMAFWRLSIDDIAAILR